MQVLKLPLRCEKRDQCLAKDAIVAAIASLKWRTQGTDGGTYKLSRGVFLVPNLATTLEVTSLQ